MEISAYGKRTSSSGRVSTFERHLHYVDVAEVVYWLPRNKVRVVRFKDGVEPMTIISDELLQRIVGSAFKAGENWGMTYHEWFTPTAADHKKMLNNAVRAARKVVKRSNSKKGCLDYVLKRLD